MNVVDARNYDSKQSLRVAPLGCDLHISGIAFSDDSRRVFASLENGILEFDVDTMRRRSFPFGSIL